MALNFGAGFSGGSPLGAGGLGSALPAYVPGANPAAAQNLIPPSLNPATGQTRFQQMAGQNLTYDPAGSVPSWTDPSADRQFEYYYGIYNPQLYQEGHGRGPNASLGGTEIPLPEGWNVDNGFLTAPVNSKTAQKTGDISKYFTGGAYETRYGTLDHLNSSDGDPFFGRAEDTDRRASWEYNSGGLVRRGDSPNGYVAGGIVGPEMGQMPMQPMQEEMPMGPEQGPDQATKELIDATLMAIDPNSDLTEGQRESIVSLFIDEFGPEALEQLREEYMGNDEVPAQLTPGEVVVPKNKVLAAGGGDPNAGASSIMRMIDEMNSLQGGAPSDALGGAGGIASALA